MLMHSVRRRIWHGPPNPAVNKYEIVPVDAAADGIKVIVDNGNGKVVGWGRNCRQCGLSVCVCVIDLVRVGCCDRASHAAADRTNFAIDHGRRKRTPWGRHAGARPPNVMGGVISWTSSVGVQPST